MQDWNGKDIATRHPFGHKMAFALVRDTTFSLLHTTCSVPMTGFSTSDSIIWSSPLIVDRKAHRGYVHGTDLLGRSYIICVEYDKTPAPLTLYYTAPLPDAGVPMIALTGEGDLMILGGYNINKKHGGKLENDNFSPLASVYLLHFGNPSAVVSDRGQNDWWWALLTVAVLAVVTAIFLIRKRMREPESVILDSTSNDELMQKICALMEGQKLYLNSDLKLNDVADALNTNRNVISSCINSQRGCSFSQFVSGYRIDYAKGLMRRQPDIKVSKVWMASGFSTETSFFRTFKAVTGMTPNEFKQKID
jgi:AraC-like DNA-binding protein